MTFGANYSEITLQTPASMTSGATAGIHDIWHDRRHP